MAIRMSVVVGCDTCEVEGIPDTTTIPKGWINFSHRGVEEGVHTYYFCSVDCMQTKLETLVELRKRKLRRSSGAALHAPIVFDEWPEERMELIEAKAKEIAEKRMAGSQATVIVPEHDHP
jgi:hypothetical protein